MMNKQADAVQHPDVLDQLRPLLLGSTSAESLAGIPPEVSDRLLRQASEFIGQRQRGTHKVGVRPDGPRGSVIEILNDDMPFLLDSVAGEFQAQAQVVDLVLHPLFKADRDAGGRLLAIRGAGDSNWRDGHQESYMAFRLSKLAPEAAGPLVEAIDRILSDVRVTVTDWPRMLERLRHAIRDLEGTAAPMPPEMRGEAVEFLRWLAEGHITLLGCRDFRIEGRGDASQLMPVDGTGLGLLADPTIQVLRRGDALVAITPEVLNFYRQPSPLIITKANVRSRVHRRAHMDYVGVKIYDESGALTGELRLVGLFTSQAYVRSPLAIPILRRKVMEVVETSGFPPQSHNGKALLNVLETFPRDELFQIGVEELREWSKGILDLELRPRVRVFARVDRFDRFVSVLTYLPRDRYTTRVRERISACLADAYRGTITAYYPYFTEGPLVRLQLIVRRTEGRTPEVETVDLERQVTDILRTWEDGLAEMIATNVSPSAALIGRFGQAFPAGYSETFPPKRALEDIERLERLSPERPLSVDFHAMPGHGEARVRAAIYHLDRPILLSERVPVLENLGFTVIDERSYEISERTSEGPRKFVLHDMQLETADGKPLDLSRHDLRLEETFRAILAGINESDRFNRLIVAADADWREAALLRAYAAYLRQLGSPFGPAYISETLVRHSGMTRNLLELFHIRLDPDHPGDAAARDKAAGEAKARVEAAMESVTSLDEDRILRQLMALIEATVRTSFYQRDTAGLPLSTIALKIATAELAMAPSPRPYREIWVWSPRVEGLHLRFAPIARGGIRWSDRAQDFRTEVLGLVKAQQVKNAVIVPAGAKGGFVPKRLPRSGTRDEVQAEGVAAYRTFIQALLDITDNIVDGAIVPPRRVVRRDGDDPYLVVAADKGTATFSDIANAIATERNFWLGDAFASGGSAGYDHKGMAITARGAWECVKRHFRELDVDIQAVPFRVIGIGDMSGDVFGNGMLLSPEIRLVAAFDHRDILLDPDPDPARSFAERQRLFQLPRSSWQDYDRSLLSPGGGIHARSAKSVPLTPEVRALLGTEAVAMAPAELIHALLKSRTDLLWFGGIGTYIRASTETDAEVGDRANDAIRVTGAEVRARVIGEGANLGVTQRARVELSQRGIRLNTDFIDNSAGVNTSDQEVNIKIALGPAVRAGLLGGDRRLALLGSMTEGVAAAVLRNNYQQSLALSLAERSSVADLGAHARLIDHLEARGMLERRLEALPSAPEIAERRAMGRGLVRPELAVLLSYAKIALLHDLLASGVPDMPAFEPLLTAYFPVALSRDHGEAIKGHRLRREIIATSLTNAIVNRLGAATPLRLAEETGRPISDIACAFTAARMLLDLQSLWPRLDALDDRIPGGLQLDLYARVQQSLTPAAAWLLREGGAARDLDTMMARLSVGVAALADPTPGEALDEALKSCRVRAEGLVAAGAPADIAQAIARLPLLVEVPAITSVAAAAEATTLDAAVAVLALNERLRVGDFMDPSRRAAGGDHYDLLALASAGHAMLDARDALAVRVLRSGGDASAGAALERLLGTEGAQFEALQRALGEIASGGAMTPSRLMIAAARLGELARRAS